METEARPRYDGVELEVGWKVLGTETVQEIPEKGKRPQKTIVTNWKERTVTESFEDLSTFAKDLSESLGHRIEKCITTGASMANFFDIEETMHFLCGERLASGRIKINEGDLEEHGAETFKLFFKEVCALKHIVELNDERFDSRLH